MPSPPDIGPLPGPSRRQRDLEQQATIVRDDEWKPMPDKPGHYVNQKGERLYDPFRDPVWRRDVLGATTW